MGKLVQKLEQMAQRYDELQRLVSDPEVIASQRNYAAYLRELGGLTKVVTAWRELKSVRKQRAEAESIVAEETDRDMVALAQEEVANLTAREADLAAQIKRTFAAESGDMQRNAILEIRAGTGGDEAALFAGDLLRMYLKYAEAAGLKTRIIDSSATNMGGFREVIVAVEGAGAYGRFRFESGGHRVQRVPETESQGRIHTSLVTVAVLPEAEDVEVEVNPNDLRVDFYCASGPGGQKVNKTSSAVRITHEPTGIVAQCQDCPSQRQNREQAMRVLRARLYDHFESQKRAEREASRRSQIGSGDRGDKVRTYNFPQSRVTDHRINLSLYNLEQVMQGQMQELIDALNEAELAQSEAELSLD